MSLEDVESEGGDKRVGPVVRRVSGMIMRVKRLEGFSGLYKGEQLSSIFTGLAGMCLRGGRVVGEGEWCTPGRRRSRRSGGVLTRFSLSSSISRLIIVENRHSEGAEASTGWAGSSGRGRTCSICELTLPSFPPRPTRHLSVPRSERPHLGLQRRFHRRIIQGYSKGDLSGSIPSCSFAAFERRRS